MKIRLSKNPLPEELSYGEIREVALKIFEAETAKAKGKDKPQTPADKRKPKAKFPMDYILYKFPNFKSVLTELLTVTFKNYIDNIYVVAPKPTTFKVVLKNKQDFLIIYDERSYIVKVQGKKYYLLNLGEKQRATQAVADLLLIKKYISTKENTGEEEGSTESDSGESSSGGGSSGGGSFPGGGDTSPGAETGAGAAEEEGELTGDDLDALLGGTSGEGETEPETGGSEEPPLAENTVLRITKPLRFG